MKYAKVTNRATGEVHYDSTPESLDPDKFEILHIVGGRPPEEHEIVADTGRVRVDFDKLRAIAWDKVKSRRDQAESAVATTSLGPVQIDEKSQAKIERLALRATNCKATGRAFTETFTLADNREVPLSADAAIVLSIEVGEHISAVYARARALRHTIMAQSATAKALLNIDVETGWP